jgi:hypothetical protein
MATRDIVLTKGQQEGLEELLQWMKQDIFYLRFSLTGRAGTGKTTLINTFLRQCGVAPSSIITTAPTHKAKKVISRHTGRASETIQKLLGLRLDADVEKFDPEKPAFNQIAQPLMGNYKLVVIDEASMINGELYKLILKEAQLFKVKVLFLGDPRQLPPVNEKVSVALKSEGSNYDLTEIIRQDGMNPIMELLDTIVGDIETNSSNFNGLLSHGVVAKVNNKGEGYILTRSKPDFVQMAIEDFKSEEFQHDFEHCKILAWRNDKVKEWNHIIRQNVFRANEQIVENDLLMGYRTIVDEFNAIRVVNSEDYVVEDVRPYTTEKNVIGVKINLRSVETGDVSQNVFVVSKESIPQFVTLYNYYFANAKARGKAGWNSFFKWRNQYLVLQDVYDSVYYEQYGEKLFVTSKDIDYGYALTVHKSQGSTYKNVYVDLRDIAYNRDVTERRKLLYVALSRTSGKCVIYF